MRKYNLVKMEIKLATTVLVCAKPYMVPFAKRPIAANIMKKLLENRTNRKSNSPYISDIVRLEKNGEHRNRYELDGRNINSVYMTFTLFCARF